MAALPEEAERTWGDTALSLSPGMVPVLVLCPCFRDAGNLCLPHSLPSPAVGLTDSSTRSALSRAPASNPVRISSLRLPAGAAGAISPYQHRGAAPVALLLTRTPRWQSCCCPACSLPCTGIPLRLGLTGGVRRRMVQTGEDLSPDGGEWMHRMQTNHPPAEEPSRESWRQGEDLFLILRSVK